MEHAELTGADRLASMEAELAALTARECAAQRAARTGPCLLQPPTEPWRSTLFPSAGSSPVETLRVDRHSSTEDKVALFRSLFVGRDDVYALRWENKRSGKSGWSPAVRGGWANSHRPDREHLPYSDEAVRAHLGGDIHAGLYPLQLGDTCRLLVCDFDGPGWVLDSLAYLDVAHTSGIPAALERSRSGEGGHVWVFFGGPVAAAAARRIGAYLLREAMTVRAELDLISYDRLFPAQDFMPKGSFGNLIALPLQGECRQHGTTVFLDPANLQPYEDQWAFLSSVCRLAPQATDALANGVGDPAAGPMQ